MPKTAGRSLTKGVIYGLMFLVLFTFIGVLVEALIMIMLKDTWTLPAGTVPLLLGTFGFFGSVAIAFADYIGEAEK
jgi:hypothetical protein